MKRFAWLMLPLSLAASPCYAGMGRNILKGAADQTTYIRIVSATDGTPETGVTSATSGLDLEYVRLGAAPTDLTESDLAATNSAHSDGGIKHMGGGVYRVDLPDAAVASGVDQVSVQGTCTGMVVLGVTHQLVDMSLSGQSAADLKDFADAGYDPTTNTVTGIFGTVNDFDELLATADDLETAIDNSVQPIVDALQTKVLKWVQLMVRKDSAIATDNATELTEINASGGSGAGAYNNVSDALEGQRDNVGTAGAGLTEVSGGGGDSASLLQSTTIATLTNQTTFTLTDGSADNDAYNGAVAVFTDSVTSAQKSFVPIKDYVGSQKKVILLSSPKFTIATGDTVKIVMDTKPLLSAAFVDRNHTWRFDNSRQTTAPNRITENTSFDGLTKIDFTNVIDSDDSIATINSVTISPTAGDEPTLGTSYIYTDSMSVIVPIACTEDGDPCDTGTFTVTISVTTADAQTYSRSCRFIVE